VNVLRGACEKLRLDGVRALLAAGAGVHTADTGESALAYAVYAECPEDRIGDKIAVIYQLFYAGASAWDYTRWRTVLHWRFLDKSPFREEGPEPGDLSIVFPVVHHLLYREPGLAHWRDNNGVSALMEVVRNPMKHAGMVRALLDAGADPRARDNDGVSVLEHLFYVDCRTEDKHIVEMCEILRMLLAAGADPINCFWGGLLMHVLSLSDTKGRDENNDWSFVYTDGARSTMLGYILEAIASGVGCLRPAQSWWWRWR
jgi:hypothetical protein